MSVRLSSYKASFDFFKTVSYKTDEYFLKGELIGAPIKKFPTNSANTLVLEGLVIEQKRLSGNNSRTVVKQEAIERFHPNNIDNKDFWKESRTYFPLVSICGGESCKSIKQVNKRTLQFSDDMGLLSFLRSLIQNSEERLKILEIGCGYGNLFFDVKDKCDYSGIDYVIHKSLKKYQNFIEINSSGIPEQLYKKEYFDAVYSVNVLQHCSQQDRFIYFKQASEVLKKGGCMIFTQFLMTNKNKNDVCWGLVDEKGRGYTHFFNQLTECDWDYELFYVLDLLGFESVISKIGGNFYAGVIRKK